MPTVKPVTGPRPALGNRPALISNGHTPKAPDSTARRSGMPHSVLEIFQRFPTEAAFGRALTFLTHRDGAAAPRVSLRGDGYRQVCMGSRHTIFPRERARFSNNRRNEALERYLSWVCFFFQRFSKAALAGRVTTIFLALCYPAPDRGLAARQVEAAHPARRKP
jgi:hypothetical protein